MADQEEPQDTSHQRVDKWLFYTRLVKSRSLAQAFIASGAVAVNDEVIDHASYSVVAGDRVHVALEDRDIVVVVRASGSRRGPSNEARALYLDISETLGEQRRLTSFERVQRQPRGRSGFRKRG